MREVRSEVQFRSAKYTPTLFKHHPHTRIFTIFKPVFNIFFTTFKPHLNSTLNSTVSVKHGVYRANFNAKQLTDHLC